MRFLTAALILVLWASPIVQAYGQTLSEAHCRARGHMSATAPDAAHDSVHAAHHQHTMHTTSHGSAGAMQDHDAGQQCKCGCLCAQACGASAAVAATFHFPDSLLTAPFGIRNDAAPSHAEHPAPERPPASLA